MPSRHSGAPSQERARRKSTRKNAEQSDIRHVYSNPNVNVYQIYAARMIHIIYQFQFDGIFLFILILRYLYIMLANNSNYN